MNEVEAAAAWKPAMIEVIDAYAPRPPAARAASATSPLRSFSHHMLGIAFFHQLAFLHESVTTWCGFVGS